MACAIPTARVWRIRLAGAVLLLLALLTGLAGHAPAYAYEDDGDSPPYGYDDNYDQDDNDRDNNDRDANEVVTSGPNVCTTIANLPIYSNATCTRHETEQDDGVIERKNYYATQDAQDTVRQAYEAAFRANGWTLVATEHDMADQEWEYTITHTQTKQRVQVSVETRARAAGGGTEIKIQER